MIKINEMCKELKRIYQEMNKDIEEMSKIVNKWMKDCWDPSSILFKNIWKIKETGSERF